MMLVASAFRVDVYEANLQDVGNPGSREAHFEEIMHAKCNEVCPIGYCDMASPLCIADADTRFAVNRYDRQAREEKERGEARNARNDIVRRQRADLARIEEAKAAGKFRGFVAAERAALGLKKYDKRYRFARV